MSNFNPADEKTIAEATARTIAISDTIIEVVVKYEGKATRSLINKELKAKFGLTGVQCKREITKAVCNRYIVEHFGIHTDYYDISF
jgi:hypothetical protein